LSIPSFLKKSQVSKYHDWSLISSVIELSEKTAVQKIITQAESLGFNESQQVLYLNDNEALAKK